MTEDEERVAALHNKIALREARDVMPAGSPEWRKADELYREAERAYFDVGKPKAA